MLQYVFNGYTCCVGTRRRLVGHRPGHPVFYTFAGVSRTCGAGAGTGLFSDTLGQFHRPHFYITRPSTSLRCNLNHRNLPLPCRAGENCRRATGPAFFQCIWARVSRSVRRRCFARWHPMSTLRKYSNGSERRSDGLRAAVL